MHVNKYVRFMFEPEDDNASTPAPDLVPHEGAGDVDTAPADDVTPAAPAAPAAPSLDTATIEALAGKFGSVLERHLPQAKPEEKQLTPEEAAKLLNVWEPDDAWFARYDNLDTRAAAIKEMRDGQAKHADTLARIRIQEMQKELDARYSPVLQQFQQMQAERNEQQFNSSYPELAKPAYRPLINAVTQSLVQQGRKFSTQVEAFDAIANGVVSVIQQTNPEFKLAKASSAKPSASTAIPVTTPGGGGGSAGSGGAKVKIPRAASILGSVGRG